MKEEEEEGEEENREERGGEQRGERKEHKKGDRKVAESAIGETGQRTCFLKLEKKGWWRSTIVIPLTFSSLHNVSEEGCRFEISNIHGFWDVPLHYQHNHHKDQHSQKQDFP
jgi:hypothetical protein